MQQNHICFFGFLRKIHIYTQLELCEFFEMLYKVLCLRYDKYTKHQTTGGNAVAVLRTVVWYAYFFGALVTLTPVLFRARRLKKREEAAARTYINRYVRMWCRTLLRIAGVTVEVRGFENIPQGRAVVFTPNHQSNYDIPLMLTCLDEPHGIVAKIETRKIPLVCQWMELLDCVFIDRANPRRAMEAMRQAEQLLERGRSIVVFPEGTRSKGSGMNEFKAGAFKIACKARAPVVPVAIDGSYRIMEANGNWMKPAHVVITILPPIETAGLPRAEQHTLAKTAAAQVAAVKGA